MNIYLNNCTIKHLLSYKQVLKNLNWHNSDKTKSTIITITFTKSNLKVNTVLTL